MICEGIGALPASAFQSVDMTLAGDIADTLIVDRVNTVTMASRCTWFNTWFDTKFNT